MLTLAAGEYEDRFAIVFNGLEGEDKLEEEVISWIELKIYYDKNTSEIAVNHNQDLKIFRTDLYNIIGQKIRQLDFTHYRAHVSLSFGIYILKLKTSKGDITRKIKIQ